MPLSLRFGALGIISGALFMASSASADGPTKRECAAANETAQDLRSSGKLREARQHLAICTADSCPGAIREDCAQRLQDVEAAVPTIMVEAVDPSGHDLTNVRVTMDGAPFVQQLGGTAIEVDPGEHRFTFDADGFKTKSDTFVLREGERNRSLRVVLESTVVKQETAPPATSSGVDGNTMRVLGISLGAAGAAGVVLGSIFGIVAKATYDHAVHNECEAGDVNFCTEQGVRDGESAHNQAAVATVGFVAGAALLVAGAAFYFTAPGDSPVTVGAAVSSGGGGLAVRARW